MALMLLLAGCGSKEVLRFPPERWVRDNDRIPFALPEKIEKKVKQREKALDEMVFKQMGRSAVIAQEASNFSSYIMVGGRQEALNVNNFDEVPDSTWFTNRIGRYDLTPEKAARGPGNGVPPAAGTLTIVGMRVVRKLPRFLVRDSKKNYYVIRFDPKGFPRIATGAEMIANRILHAAGYSVPDSNLMMIDPSRLRKHENAITVGKYAQIRPLLEEEISTALKSAAQSSSGKFYAISGRLFPGLILGPFKFSGRRSYDPNDRIPHEFRRELRGLLVFCDFLDFASAHPFNTLDIFKVSEDNNGYILHHMFDLSESLGSSNVHTKAEERYKESGFNTGNATTALFTFGVYDPYNREAEKRNPALGIQDTSEYKPGRWGAALPNPAFAYMTSRDAIWAGRILSRFSDDAIAAIVKTAQYGDPEKERFMTRALIERRDKAVRYWFSFMSPLDNFSLTREDGGYAISFQDLGIIEGFSNDAVTHYRQKLVTFKATYDFTPWIEFEDMKTTIPDSIVDRMVKGRVYRFKIETKRDGERWWRSAIDLFLKRGDDDLEILGLLHRYRS